MNSDQLKSALAAIEESAAKAREAIAVEPNIDNAHELLRAFGTYRHVAGGDVISLPPGLLAALGEVAMAVLGVETAREAFELVDGCLNDEMVALGEACKRHKAALARLRAIMEAKDAS